MHIVFFDHPTYLGYLSIPRFTRMLVSGMEKRGHTTEVWTPEPGFLRLPLPGAAQKWLGYLDQYLVFPARVRSGSIFRYGGRVNYTRPSLGSTDSVRWPMMACGSG